MASSIVAIIGRPNVGKSTLFNRILGERRAVVHDRPGITRDRNAVRTEWAGRSFVLIDTGGFLPTADEGRDALVRRQAEAAIAMSRAVLFMVDAQTGPTDLDRAIARDLKRIASHIASVAYPILEQSGALRRTRLLEDGEDTALQAAGDTSSR